jgi:hypothetical protein
MVSVTSEKVFLVIIVTCMMAFFFSGPAMASEDPQPEVSTERNGTNPSLDASSSDLPLIEKVSDKGIYLVQLTWPQLPLNPDGAFDLQIFFMNASQPRGPNGTATLSESNFTGSGTETGATVPETLQSRMDVESYDITIYSSDGSILWQKLDRPGMGGSPAERVTIGNYTGPVAINLTDIRPGGHTITAGMNQTDSVRFAATVVPEFPAAIVLLVAGTAGAICVLRLRNLRSLDLNGT